MSDVKRYTHVEVTNAMANYDSQFVRGEDYDAIAANSVAHAWRADAAEARVKALEAFAHEVWIGKRPWAVMQKHAAELLSTQSETDAAQTSYIKTRDCEHEWVEYDAYPYREARCRKCGATKTLGMTQCINWPCSLPRLHAGPCATAEPSPETSVAQGDDNG